VTVSTYELNIRLLAEVFKMTNSELVFEEHIPGKNGVLLRLRRTVMSDAKAAVVIVHGVGEHLDRYPYLEKWMIARGFNCYLYDHRGHGRSGGARGDVSSFHDYADDLSSVYDIVASESAPLPIFVLGHSMGSLVVLLNLIVRPGKWQAAIVTGVPLKLVRAIPKWQEVLGRLVNLFWPAFSIPSNVIPEQLTHDMDVVEAYKNDFLIQQRMTVRWGLALIDAMDEIESRLNEINDDLLILHGEDDPISSVDGARKLAQSLGDKQATLIIYPGLYHELHNEREADRNHVFRDIGAWLQIQRACTAR
jgi:alpha-beta hydrolase superfamily lysophospholipase